MKNIIHFFDLDNTLWNIDSKAWIILKNNSDKPIVKLNNIEYKNIINGFYKEDEQRIEYNGGQYWISKSLYNKIKKKYKNIELKDLGLSLVEYNLSNYFTKIFFHFENIRHVVGDNNIEFGILSGRYDVENDKNLLTALRDELSKYNINITKFYYVSTKPHMPLSSINSEKLKVILENAVGFHIKDDHFIPVKQDKYDDIHFYDDEIQNISMVNDIQFYLDEYLKNTEDDLYHKILKRLETNITINTHLISNNTLNKFITKDLKLKIPIKYSIKVDESFIIKFNDFIKKI